MDERKKGVPRQHRAVNAKNPERSDEKMKVHFSLSVADDGEQLEMKAAAGQVVPPEELDLAFLNRRCTS